MQVSTKYTQHQAPRSGYDVGDLAAFHVQHTLAPVVEDSFKEVFPQAKLVESKENIETQPPDVPAIFEVKLLDVANDIYNEASRYRAQVTLAVAMESPRGHIFWQKAFRGEGYTETDPQFSTGMGPQDAVTDAIRDALNQMQEALLKSPEVRLQMKHYKEVEQARRQKEVQV